MFATAAVPSPEAAAPSRSITRRYSGVSSSPAASTSTMPRTVKSSRLRSAAYFFSVVISSPWRTTTSALVKAFGSSCSENVTPGIFSSSRRAVWMNPATFVARAFRATSLTKTVASRTVSESPAPIDA